MKYKVLIIPMVIAFCRVSFSVELILFIAATSMPLFIVLVVV